MLQQRSRTSEVAAEPGAEDEDSYQEIQQEENGDQQQISEGERMATEAHGDVYGAEVSIGDGDYQVVGIIFIIVC